MFEPVQSNFFTPTHTHNSLQSIEIIDTLTHAVSAILLGMMVDMLIQQKTAFQPETSPFEAPKLDRFNQFPKFFIIFSPELLGGRTEHSARPERKQAPANEQKPVDQIISGIQALAKQNHLESKTRKEMEAVKQNLLELRQTNRDNTKKEAAENLQTSVNKLVRRLSLYLHPDKNTSSEATEAFQQLHKLRDELDHTLQTAC